MTSYVKARRAHSMPSRYMIPSAEMGEYEDGRRRSAPARPPTGKLYPLSEEGMYGAPPPGPRPPPPPYKPRERKTKIYSSYAVDSKCDVHSKKLAEVEKDHGTENIRKLSWSRRASASPARRIPSASPSRAASTDRGSSVARSSKSPEPQRKPLANAANRPVTVRKLSSDKKPGYSSASWATSSTTSSVSSASSTTRYSTNYRYNTDLKNSSFEENEEYEYEEKQRRQVKPDPGYGRKHSKNYSSFAKDYDFNPDPKDGLSLGSLRKPTINSWDSMGILGLSSKMWNDTRKKQESILNSGGFMRDIM
eukprot:maker-scaffold29_size597861-snap-gene-4.37 protein:Tk04651 transcript:maker-scaffold29_size597861-snap-gene-4.37-mRNA-1 annotation:"polyketide synthase of type i"